MSWDFMDFRSPGLVLAVISSIFMDFYDSHEFSEDFMDFRGPRSAGLFGAFAAECGRGPAPLEIFTRSQLAAISSILIDSHDLHRFAGDFMRFEGFSKFS